MLDRALRRSDYTSVALPDDNRRRIYLRLWQEAHALLQKHDPCRFAGNICVAGLEDGCCLCPEHVPGQPCSRRSLGCKLHLCNRIRAARPELEACLAPLRSEAERWGLSLEVFSTFE